MHAPEGHVYNTLNSPINLPQGPLNGIDPELAAMQHCGGLWLDRTGR